MNDEDIVPPLPLAEQVTLVTVALAFVAALVITGFALGFGAGRVWRACR